MAPGDTKIIHSTATRIDVPTSAHAWVATNLWTRTPPNTGLAKICGKHYGLSW